MALDGCEVVYALEYPSSKTRPEVPSEIWTMIAQFIPGHVLWELRTVSSAFFQAALDERYRVFQLVDCDLNDRGWARTLSRWERMRQFDVGARVRSVIVDAEFIGCYFKYCDDDRKTEVYTPKTQRRVSWISKVPNDFLRHLRLGRRRNSLKQTEEGPPHQDAAPRPEPFEEYSRALADTLACFSCVTEMEIRWSFNTGDFHSILVMAYVWMCLRTNLRRLKWEASMQDLHLLLLESPSIRFPVLRDLCLKLRRPPPDEHHTDDDERFQISIAPFVNRHCATIQSLSILGVTQFSPPIDIAYLLSLVGHFPHLRHLSLEFGIVAGQYIQISIPAVLARFMDNHASTLRHLSVKVLGVHRSCMRHTHDVYDTFQMVFGGLSKLTTLEIYYDAHALYVFRMSKLKDAVLATARGFADTLTTLILDATFDQAGLTLEQVETLVMAFSHRPAATGLTTLLLVVDILSPQLVDLLASALPGLKKLTLQVRLIQMHQTSRRYYRIHSGVSSPDAVYSLDTFQSEMERRVYDNWALRQIDIWQTSPWSVCILAAKIIAERIPDAEEMQIGYPPLRLTRRSGGTISWT